MKNILLSVFCLAVLVGCSQRPADMPELHSVTITVTMNGKPLEGALISCVPENNGTWFAGGMTDVHGQVRPQTKGRYHGIPLGNFKIIVAKTGSTENSTPEKIRLVRLVHSKFGDLATTPLTCTIEKTTRSVEFNVEPAPLNDFIED
ncbi:MAG: hypothetical protein LBI18_14345 [Planctomycetaceae bacterium]|nr:hypothetical protein [Planctomycetaceae bacterium]